MVAWLSLAAPTCCITSACHLFVAPRNTLSSTFSLPDLYHALEQTSNVA
jgi:hypothetical protein